MSNGQVFTPHNIIIRELEKEKFGYFFLIEDRIDREADSSKVKPLHQTVNPTKH